MAVPQDDLPRTYSSLDLRSEEIAPDVEPVNGPLIGKSFEDKNARVMFTQKVLCIFILQSISVGIFLGIFAYNRIVMKHCLIAVEVGAMIAIIVVACLDHLKSSKIYNYMNLVYYPISTTSVLVIVPNLFDMEFESKLRQAFLFSWLAFILAIIAILFLVIFSLDCKKEFTLMKKFIITNSVFSISSFVVYLPLYMENSDFDLISSLCLIVFLYVYFLYILYDIDVMTSGHYRSPLTPADYVTGAVNMHIDYLFIIRDFIKKKCCCGNVQ